MRRLEQRQEPAQHGVRELRRVRDVQVERHELRAQAALRLVRERGAAVPAVAVPDAPVDDVAQRVEVEPELERDRVVETEILVVDRVAVEHAEAERDDATALTPDEEPDLLRQLPADTAEELRRQLLEPEAR